MIFCSRRAQGLLTLWSWVRAPRWVLLSSCAKQSPERLRVAMGYFVHKRAALEHARARGGSSGEGKHIGSKRVVFTDVCVSRTAAAWSSGMILGYGGGGVRASQQLFAVRPRLSRACGLWRHVIRAGSCAVTWPNAALQRGGSRKVRAEVVSGTMLARRNFASVLRSSARSVPVACANVGTLGVPLCVASGSQRISSMLISRPGGVAT